MYQMAEIKSVFGQWLAVSRNLSFSVPFSGKHILMDIVFVPMDCTW